MEAKKVRGGVEIRFVPVRGWTCRQQSAYSALSPRFFPSTAEFPIPAGVEWKLENES